MVVYNYIEVFLINLDYLNCFLYYIVDDDDDDDDDDIDFGSMSDEAKRFVTEHLDIALDKMARFGLDQESMASYVKQRIQHAYSKYNYRFVVSINSQPSSF
jgi:hypothetical protein